MKLKPLHMMVPILLTGFIAATPGFSQEERTNSELEITISKNDSQPIIEGEARPVKPTVTPTTQRDSVQVKPVSKVTKPSEKSQKNTEDPLSFNFLYYIIEKFKLSDIIE